MPGLPSVPAATKVDIDKQGARDSLLEGQYKAIYTNPNKMTFRIDEELLKGTAVEVVCTASTGTNHIDIDYCEKNNIEVISLTVDYETIKKITSTAEMAFTLMLALVRNLPKAVDGVKEYDWNYENYIGRQLNCLDVGIIGYGRLGTHFARFCEPFFRNIFINDPYKATPLDLYQQTSFHNLLSESDVVALHVHLNKDTRHMINKASIRSMKDGAYLVNTSRGDIVDEDAVIDAIKSGKLKGYATDVISDELGGDLKNSKLIQAMKEGYNIIISPHIAGMTKEAQELAYCRVASRLLEFSNDR